MSLLASYMEGTAWQELGGLQKLKVDLLLMASKETGPQSKIFKQLDSVNDLNELEETPPISDNSPSQHFD